MGNTSSANLSAAATLDTFIGELGDLTFEKTLNSSRFLKCVRARHQDGQVIVKLFIKSGNVNLTKESKQMQAEKELLMGINNTLSYQRLVETDRAVYLVRQYIFSNLYDRISTRPFLEAIEKRWIVYQLLTGLRDCHARNIHHGDIKTENVLVTSWNWVYLTDFAFFKPTYLPENNPADFSFFFDTSFRRTCYLAPERFHSPSVVKTGSVTDAMDMFSLGCVIAELFLEGTPLFDLSQLLRYKTGEYDPSIVIDRIEDIEVRLLVAHMVQLDPDKRHSAESYLLKWQRRVFPSYFSTFAHEYISLITEPQRHHSFVPSADLDDALDRIFFEFDKISFFLGFDDNDQYTNRENTSVDASLLSIPNYKHSNIAPHKRATGEDGALIFLSILLSGVRNTTRAATRVRTCDTILALSERISDEAKLDRVVPFLVALLGDDAPNVRCCALRSLTQLLSMIGVLTPVNAFVFPEYILPRLRAFTIDSNVLARVTYARCIASIARSATRFLEMASALRLEGFLTLVEASDSEDQPSEEGSFTMLFDMGKKDQRNLIHEHVSSLLTDQESVVKRTLLESIAELCQFFGRQEANDMILSHLITYLNDRDWLLKAAFFKNVVSLSAYLGIEAVEEYILPLLVQSLTDTEDFIVVRVLAAMTELAKQQLIRTQIASSIVTIVVRFLVHPNLWIQEGAAYYLMTVAKDMSLVDRHCILYPQIRPYVRTELANMSDTSLLQSLRRPLPPLVLESAYKWAATSTKSLFWQSATKHREFSGDFSDIDPSRPAVGAPPPLSSKPQKEKDRASPHRTSIAKSNEDEAFLTKLRSNGLKPEDEWKLVALREYIWRVAHLKLEMQKSLQQKTLQAESAVVPMTIFFDKSDDAKSRHTTKFKHAAHDVQSVLRDASLSLDSGRGPRPFRRIASPAVHLARSPRDTPRSDRAKPMNGPNESTTGTGISSAHQNLARLTIDDSKTASQASSVNGDLRHASHKGSALNLPGVSSKAAAEVATTNTTALGVIDHQCVIEETSEIKVAVTSAPKISHTYLGSDVNILNLLDKMYLEGFHESADDFGKQVSNIPPRSLKKASISTFRPEGTLVAHIQEHSAAINRISISPDHLFFTTCSDDGTIKVWDSSKLERNVANRARLTYRGLTGSKVKTTCFLEKTYCIAAAADSGAIHIIKIDCVSSLTAPAKYGSMHAVKKYELPDNEYAIHIEHYLQDQGSFLLVATNMCRIVALDTRSMKIVFTLDNPVHHGMITSFCIDRKHTWLLLGTNRGILDLWDLRFKLRLKSIGLPESDRVNRVHLHPSKGRGRWVCIAAGKRGELTVWDLEKSQCREVYRPLQSSGESTADVGYTTWNVEDTTPEDMLNRLNADLASGVSTESESRQPEVRALAVVHESEDRKCNAFLLGASTDQKIRYWDLQKVEHSSIISGAEQDEERCSYSSTMNGGINIYQEDEHRHASKRPKPKSQQSGQQSQMLRDHMDTILDVGFLQWPYPMIISADRSGVLKVTA